MPGLLHRHRVLAHGLEQRRLGARRRAVDLIRENDIGEKGSLNELKGSGILTIDRDPDDIRRQGVGCELDAVEIELERPRERLGQGRLPDSRNVFEQHVTAGQKRRDERIDDLRLAADHPHDGGV